MSEVPRYPPKIVQCKSSRAITGLVHRSKHQGGSLTAVSFVYFSVECPFNKFHGINCRPKLGAKLLDRFFHWRRQVSPPVKSLTHCFFDGSQHFFNRNFT